MITTITKRDGRTVHFDINKIASAIEKAFAATIGKKDYAICLALAQEVSDIFEEKQIDSPTVEQIQDTVERVLINHGHVRTAKAYILYRAERTRVRNMNDRLMKTFEDITYKDATDSDIKRENANIDGNTAMGSMLKYGSEGAKHFYESYVLNPAHSEAHRNGDIHIHDLDFYTLTTTCCQIDLIKLFHDGFSTGHGVLREPNDIASYASLACIAIQSNQNDQHGGQSIANFDYGLAPGVAKTSEKIWEFWAKSEKNKGNLPNTDRRKSDPYTGWLSGIHRKRKGAASGGRRTRRNSGQDSVLLREKGNRGNR